MKDKILEVLHKHDQDPHGVDMSGQRRINADAAAEDLTALMCYQEVRIFYIAYEMASGRTPSDEAIFESFRSSYDREDIYKSIKQIKG